MSARRQLNHALGFLVADKDGAGGVHRRHRRGCPGGTARLGCSPGSPTSAPGPIWACARALSSPTVPHGRHKDSARILQALPWKLLSTPRCGDRDAHQGEDNTMRNPSRRHLRSVRDIAAPSLQFLTIHGHRRAFRIAGSGPVIVMLHGVGDSSTTWEPVHAKLAQRFTVIAPDLLGHGESDKPRADYSLASFANGLRDLLTALGIDRVTLVGHSYGGGLAAQFAYQYPQFVERIVLVSAGGVTKDVSLALRLAAMPMGAEALSVLRVPGAVPALELVSRVVGNVVGSTRFTRDAGKPAAPGRRVAQTGCRGRIRTHSARGGRHARPVRHDAGPHLSDAGPSGADHLGRGRPDHPGKPRSGGPRADPRFAPRDLRAVRTRAARH